MSSSAKALDSITPKPPPTCSVVIAAAGSSSRCKGEDKLLYRLNGKPVIAHSIEAFERCALVREIVVVARSEQLDRLARLCRDLGFSKVTKVIAGGETRTESVNNGVFAVSPRAKYIAIHDGARPLIDTQLIEATLRRAGEYSAAAPGVPVIPTIKRAEGARKTIIIKETDDREGLFEIQTPQVFKADIIKAALTDAIDKGVALTDDCMAVELLGMPVHIVPGDRRNIKITEPEDLKIAEALLCE